MYSIMTTLTFSVFTAFAFSLLALPGTMTVIRLEDDAFARRSAFTFFHFLTERPPGKRMEGMNKPRCQHQITGVT